MLPEMVKSLQEATHQVLSLVEDCTFFSILVIVEEPELIAFWIVLLFQSFHTTSGFVFVVDHQSFEVEEVPWTWW
jgi:hypothetical protein